MNDRSSTQISGEATISHVAQRAGVSLRTVSRVINNSPDVNLETRSRVLDAIRSLNYKPSLRARALASKQSFLIGLVHDDPSAVVLDHVQRGIFSVCTARGYELVIHPCHFGAASLVDDVLNFARRSRVDGLVLIPPVSESHELAHELRSNGVATVAIASVAVADVGLMLVARERDGVAAMADHLVSLGHRRFGLIAGPRRFRSALEREAGFLGALQAHGIEIEEQYIREGDYEFESGIACAESILGLPAPPTAIFASNDRMAAGVLKFAAQSGIRVPDDLSVAGFDDSTIAGMLNPGLTTICRPMRTLAEQAALWLTDKTADHANPNEPRFTALSLVIRESTGPALR